MGPQQQRWGDHPDLEEAAGLDDLVDEMSAMKKLMKDMHKSAKRSATMTVEARNRLARQQVQHESVMRNVIKVAGPRPIRVEDFDRARNANARPPPRATPSTRRELSLIGGRAGAAAATRRRASSLRLVVAAPRP